MRADTCFEHATKGFLCLECQSKYEALAQKTVRWNMNTSTKLPIDSPTNSCVYALVVNQSTPAASRLQRLESHVASIESPERFAWSVTSTAAP